jgi:hypothetical protein
MSQPFIRISQFFGVVLAVWIIVLVFQVGPPPVPLDKAGHLAPTDYWDYFP